MASSREDFDYTTGGDSRVMHKRKIGAGGYGDVHEVHLCLKSLTLDV
jgi:hypothetical protein